jgi:hypothetical protein
VLAGVAVAASRLISTGEPVPTNRRFPGLFGPIQPGTTKLLSVRTADPDGGPPWGLRVYRTTVNQGSGQRPVGCVQVGRVVDARLGVLGQDGSFHNDGRFHELPVQPDGCGGLDARGQLFFDGQAMTQVASADPRQSCETAAQRQDRTVDVPRALRASLRRKLRSGDRRAVPLERRLLARQTRRAAQDIPLCPTGDLRTITYGLVGSLASRVTATDPTTRQSVRPVAAENGAYLIVLSGPAEQHRPLKITTFYPNDLVCGRGAATPDANRRQATSHHDAPSVVYRVGTRCGHERSERAGVRGSADEARSRNWRTAWRDPRKGAAGIAPAGVDVAARVGATPLVAAAHQVSALPTVPRTFV